MTRVAPLIETPDVHGAFPRLSRRHVDALAAHGERRPTQPGQVLCREGDRGCEFFVLLAGKVAAVEDHGGPEERVLHVHGQGRFLGELDLLTGGPAFLTGVVREEGEVLAVPVDRLRELVGQDSALGDLVLRAYLARRSMLIERGAALHASPNGRRQPFSLETGRPGVFAAGDVRSGSTRRVASAVGEGAMAVRQLHEHLEEVGGPAGREQDVRSVRLEDT